ncbi:AAA family ATPase [Acidovorax sp. sic0104]|nr:AAA family ATPase [Acidovorax sp. sic0104]
MLVVLAGLPGVGKSTIARALLARWPAVYLRIDTIEQALRDSDALQGGDVGPAGYMVAYALAGAQLALGLPVLVDCVNPLPVTRKAWHGVAHDAQARCLDVEVVCSDVPEHRRRVEQRTSDVPGHVPPAWAAVCQHAYAPWPAAAGLLAIDSARCSAEAAATLILSRVAAP